MNDHGPEPESRINVQHGGVVPHAYRPKRRVMYFFLPTRQLEDEKSRIGSPCLDLPLLKAVLPDDDIGSDTILTIVQEDHPKR